MRRTGSRAAALDLTAETFAQVWLVRARFRDEAGGSAAPWVYGIARNVLLMSIRRSALERRATERIGVQERLDRPQPVEPQVPDDTWADGADELPSRPFEGDPIMTRLDLDPDLDRLGDALRASAAMDLAREEHAGHRRVTACRGVAAGAVALAAAAAGVVVLAQPPSGQSAWARQTLQRAAAVVIPAGSANTILHVTATETFSRQIYNKTTNTVYPAPQFPKGKPHLTPAKPGRYATEPTSCNGFFSTSTAAPRPRR